MKEDTDFLPDRVNDQCGSRDEQTAPATAPLTFKGTPGPWEYPEPYVGSLPLLNVVCSDDRGPAFHARSHEEQEANARLIAAAPDLLEALQKCSTELAVLKDGSVGGVPNSVVALIPEALEAADAAIAKATGAPQ